MLHAGRALCSALTDSTVTLAAPRTSTSSIAYQSPDHEEGPGLVSRRLTQGPRLVSRRLTHKAQGWGVGGAHKAQGWGVGERLGSGAGGLDPSVGTSHAASAETAALPTPQQPCAFSTRKLGQHDASSSTVASVACVLLCGGERRSGDLSVSKGHGKRRGGSKAVGKARGPRGRRGSRPAGTHNRNGREARAAARDGHQPGVAHIRAACDVELS